MFGLQNACTKGYLMLLGQALHVSLLCKSKIVYKQGLSSKQILYSIISTEPTSSKDDNVVFDVPQSVQGWQARLVNHALGPTQQTQRCLRRAKALLLDELLCATPNAALLILAILGSTEQVVNREALVLCQPIQILLHQNVLLCLVGKDQLHHGWILWILQDSLHYQETSQWRCHARASAS